MLDSIETQVFSLISSRFSKNKRKDYPNINFTTSDSASTKPKFPTVYIHMIDSSEVGSDLDGTSIPGVNTSFQIDVSDNQNNNRTDDVAREVLRVMKGMRFKPVTMPMHNNNGGVYVTTARYRRVIGDGDKL